MVAMRFYVTKAGQVTCLSLICAVFLIVYFFIKSSPISSGVELGSGSSKDVQKNSEQFRSVSANLSELASTVDQLSVEVGVLIDKQNEIENLISSQSGVSQKNEDVAIQDEPEVRLSEAERQSRFEQTRLDQRDNYEALIHSGSDTTEAWSAQQERHFEILFIEDPVISGAHNGNIACSNGHCQLEYEIPKGMSLTDQDILDMSLAVELGSDIANSTRYKDDLDGGDTKMTFYLSQADPISQKTDSENNDEG